MSDSSLIGSYKMLINNWFISDHIYALIFPLCYYDNCWFFLPIHVERCPGCKCEDFIGHINGMDIWLIDQMGTFLTVIGRLLIIMPVHQLQNENAQTNWGIWSAYLWATCPGKRVVQGILETEGSKDTQLFPFSAYGLPHSSAEVAKIINYSRAHSQYHSCLWAITHLYSVVFFRGWQRASGTQDTWQVALRQILGR